MVFPSVLHGFEFEVIPQDILSLVIENRAEPTIFLIIGKKNEYCLCKKISERKRNNLDLNLNWLCQFNFPHQYPLRNPTFTCFAVTCLQLLNSEFFSLSSEYNQKNHFVSFSEIKFSNLKSGAYNFTLC